MKKVLIIDDHYIVRKALANVVEDLLNHLAVVDDVDTSEIFPKLSAMSPDLIIMDIAKLEVAGFGIVEKIRRLYSKIRILVFSSANENIYASFFLKAGANGFLSKTAERKEIESAIRSVLDTGHYLSVSIRNLLLSNLTGSRKNRDNPIMDLSARELEVMDMLTSGLWLKEISCKLNISESSVSTYKSRIFSKLSVNNIIELHQKALLYKSLAEPEI